MKKRGDTVIMETVIFIILNLVFFTVLFYFVNRVGTGALFYEQLYAKQISLLIDNAKPGTTIVIDMADALKLAEKNSRSKNIFTIDSEKNRVVVGLGLSGEYGYRYFSDYDVNVKINGVYLEIEIKEKK